MLGNLGCFLLLASSWFTAWRFYVWAKREETRANKLEVRLLALANTSWGGDDTDAE